MNYALVTGATGGLGRQFAYLLAERGEALLLTGRSAEKLASLREEIVSRFPKSEILFESCDLSDADDRARFFAKIGALRFSLLVNVAGADIQKAFADYTREKLLFQARVNFEAAVDLAKFVFEHRGDSLGVLTVSSVSGLYPMPYFALYSATKCALTSFFSALHVEWKGVASVTTVLPGSIPTREDVKAYIAAQGLWGKLAAMPPEKVAKKSLDALKRNKRTYIPGFWNKLMRAGTALLPLPWKMRFIAARWSKTEKDAF